MSESESAPQGESTPAPAKVATVAPKATTKNQGKQATEQVQAGLPKSEPVGAEMIAPAGERKPRVVKGKVNGEDKAWNLDEMDDEELSTRFQLEEASRQRMQQAAKLEKDYKTKEERLKKDPFSALKEFYDLDIDQLMEQRIEERFKDTLMTDEERGRKQLEAERDRYKTEAETNRKKYDDYTAKLKAEEEDKEAFAQLEKDFTEALEDADLPKNDPRMMKMLADFALEANRQERDITPKQMAYFVKQQMQADVKHVLKVLGPDKLLTWLDPEVINKIVQYKVDQARAGISKQDKPSTLAQMRKTVEPEDTEDDNMFNRSLASRLKSWR